MFAFTPKQDAQGFIMPTFIQKNDHLSLGAKYLYGVLCDYARDRNFCYPSKKTLAKQVKCSLNSIRSWLKELIKYGFVKTFFNGVKDIFYLFCPAKKEEKISSCTRSNFAQDRSNFEPKSNVFKTNNIPPTPKILLRTENNNPPQTHQRKRVGDFSNMNKSFEEFWNVYPKKEAKESARSVWYRFFRQGKLPDVDVLKKAVDFFSESFSWQRESGRYVPHLANFIRGLRWEDIPKDVPKESREPRKATPSIPFKIESPKEENERIQRMKQENEKHVQLVEIAYKNFASFFQTPTPVNACIAYGLFSSLCEKGITPATHEKQTVDILEFLKNTKMLK